jgi:hypothetical protein
MVSTFYTTVDVEEMRHRPAESMVSTFYTTVDVEEMRHRPVDRGPCFT